MSFYSRKNNYSYESVDECNSSSDSDRYMAQMSRERWSNSSNRRSLNSSTEETPHTYINPLINVPSYTQDRNYNSRNSNGNHKNHVYHPMIFQPPPQRHFNDNGYHSNNNFHGSPSMYYNNRPQQPPNFFPHQALQYQHQNYRPPLPSLLHTNTNYHTNSYRHPNAHRYNNRISPQSHHYRHPPPPRPFNNYKSPNNSYRPQQNFGRKSFQNDSPAQEFISFDGPGNQSKDESQNETMDSSMECSKTDCSLVDIENISSTAILASDSSVNHTLESSIDHTMPNETMTSISLCSNATFGTSMNQSIESSFNASLLEESNEMPQPVTISLPFPIPNLVKENFDDGLDQFDPNALILGSKSIPSDSKKIGSAKKHEFSPKFSNQFEYAVVPDSKFDQSSTKISIKLEAKPESPSRIALKTHSSNGCDDLDKTDKTVNESLESADDSGVKPNESCDDTANDDSGVRAENESYSMNESDLRPEHESSGIVEDIRVSEEIPKNAEKTVESVQPYQILDENSSNAVDHNISRSASNEYSSDLSFNGKFKFNVSEKETITSIPKMFSKIRESLAADSDNSLTTKSEIKLEDVEEEETEEEKLRNESFELLQKEDSSMMLYVNERSPDPHSRSHTIFENSHNEDEKIVAPFSKAKSEKNDIKIFNRLRKSILGICPPPTVTKDSFTMDQLIKLYNENEAKETIASDSVKLEAQESFFRPTHTPEEVVEMTEHIRSNEMSWREMLHMKCHDVHYNRSTYCESIERMCLKYSEKFVGGETNSSINIVKSPCSLKKKNERLKLLTQSPGSRLSHLARRRTMFSSANLKSCQAPVSQQSVTNAVKPLLSRQILVDKKKLQKSQNSPKKKTPGRRKTPKSAKRQLQLQQSKLNQPKSSKRALFTSPVQPKVEESQPSSSNSASTLLSNLTTRLHKSKRALFSPSDGNRKRNRTDSVDSDDSVIFGNLLKPTKRTKIENSPNKFLRSFSFSVAGANSSGSASDSGGLHRRSLFRTQSECISQQSQQSSQSSVGFRQPLTEEHKRKLLWAVSSALANKQISKDHEKFNGYAKILVNLTKKIFVEFYDPLIKSTSNQMLKIANGMVFYVVQGRSAEEIYKLTKENYQKTRNITKVAGYITQEEYERNKRNLVRKNSSLLFQSMSNSSLNIYSSSENIIDGNSLPSSGAGSNSKRSEMSENTSSASKKDLSNRSTSKNNETMGALRENFLKTDSGQKISQRPAANDSSSKLFAAKTNVLKAKRQISF